MTSFLVEDVFDEFDDAFTDSLFDNFSTWANEFDKQPPKTPVNSELYDFPDEFDVTQVVGPTGFVDETKIQRWRNPRPDFSFSALRPSSETIAVATPAVASAPTEDPTPSTSATFTSSSVTVDKSHETPLPVASSTVATKKRKAAGQNDAAGAIKDKRGTGAKSLPAKLVPQENVVEPAVASDDVSLERRVVEVLNYTSTLFRALNNGNLKDLRSILDNIFLPTCILRTHAMSDDGKSMHVQAEVPFDKIFDYFVTVGTSFPDAIWRVEDTKLRNTKPKTVASRCHFRGTHIANDSAKVLESFTSEAGNTVQYSYSDMITQVVSTGTIVMTLDARLRIQKMDIFYHAQRSVNRCKV